MADSVAPVIRRGVLLALLALLWAAPAEAKTTTHTWRVGPVDMRGYATEQALEWTRAPKRDGYLTAMYARIVDAAGRPVPQERVMLHHVFFVNHGRFPGDRRAGDCRRRNGETFYGTGEEDQAIELPPGYGYRLRKGDRWRVGWMFMNHRHLRERVYLQYTITVTDEPRTPVTPYWISVSCADGKIYSVPGDGGVHERSRTWRVPRGGRIVAGAAHAHGGALSVDVADERCGGRTLLSSQARYGLPDDPIYNLSPVLHEPAPRSMSVTSSAAGWAVSRGDRLKVVSRYANGSPHSAVMGIMHLYIAHGAGRPEPCPPLPADVQTHRLAFLGAPGIAEPPLEQPELSALGPDGVAYPVADLAGPVAIRAGDAEVKVRNAAFRPRRLSVPSGAVVRWRFSDPVQHDVTLASGPRGFASAYTTRGSYRKRLTVPGRYKIFCSLHPVTMSQTIEVRP
jgi:plastocyanin